MTTPSKSCYHFPKQFVARRNWRRPNEEYPRVQPATISLCQTQTKVIITSRDNLLPVGSEGDLINITRTSSHRRYLLYARDTWTNLSKLPKTICCPSRKRLNLEEVLKLTNNKILLWWSTDDIDNKKNLWQQTIHSNLVSGANGSWNLQSQEVRNQIAKIGTSTAKAEIFRRNQAPSTSVEILTLSTSRTQEEAFPRKLNCSAVATVRYYIQSWKWRCFCSHSNTLKLNNQLEPLYLTSNQSHPF